MMKRSKLLKLITERDYSTDTIMRTGEILRGLTDSMKEERAGQMLTLLQESKTEQEFKQRIKHLNCRLPGDPFFFDMV